MHTINKLIYQSGLNTFKDRPLNVTYYEVTYRNLWAKDFTLRDTLTILVTAVKPPTRHTERVTGLQLEPPLNFC